jgi:hypothetical protein
MNALYALIIACLSLQVWFGPSATPTASINVTEYTTARELLEANGTTAAIPGLADYTIQTGLAIDDYIAAVIVPATPRIEDHSINTGVDFYADDDGWDFDIPAKTDLHAIQASDWW